MLAKKKKNPLAQLLTAPGPSPLDLLVDAYVTPEGLTALILDPTSIKNARSLPTPEATEGPPRDIDWSKACQAFFTSPRDFAVDQQGITLRFRFNGVGWKLHAIDLQLDQPNG